MFKQRCYLTVGLFDKDVICLSMYLSVCLSVSVSISLCLCLSLSAFVSVCVCVWFSVSLSLSLSLCLCKDTSIYSKHSPTGVSRDSSYQHRQNEKKEHSEGCKNAAHPGSSGRFRCKYPLNKSLDRNSS